MVDLLRRVRETILKNELLASGETVIVGVSGGPDSTCLLHLLARLRDELGICIIAAHINHSFRGEEADCEEEWVQKTAEAWGIPCMSRKINVKALAKEWGISAQDAGHRVRQEYFAEISRKTGAQKIALGHHADDQTETVIMHFLKGAGPEGLRGMLMIREQYIRPLLEIPKAELEAYCLENKLDPRRDPSNQANDYLRNKLRNQMIPWIKENINPNIVDTLGRSSKIFAAENEYIDEAFYDLEKKYITYGANETTIKIEGFKTLSLALQRRIVRKVLIIASSERTVQFTHVEQLRELILKKQVGKINQFPGGVRAQKEYYRVKVFAEGTVWPDDPAAKIPEIAERKINIPGRIFIHETGDILTAEYAAELPLKIASNCVFVPCGKIEGMLTVRRRREGDIFIPRNRKKKKKLKEYFIEQKIPREKRDAILLIASGKDVLWIPGIEYGRGVNEHSPDNGYIVLKIRKRTEDDV